jgi:hypothetical protein
MAATAPAANKDSKSDPDDANELVRLHTAADVLRVFARHFKNRTRDLGDHVLGRLKAT